MNDPHVVALNYLIEHGETFDYSKAESLCRDEPDFHLTVKDGRARFEFKEHYATTEQAKEVVEEYIDAWVFDATLKRGTADFFGLKFEEPEIIDRNPTKGEARLRATIEIEATGSATVTLGLGEYPSPPSDIILNADVRTMHHRYMGYRQGHEPLESMSYFCLNMLEGSIGRRAAARRFNIVRSILNKIGSLSSTKGGISARKRVGVGRPLTTEERKFLDAAVRAIIRRAAEGEHTPAGRPANDFIVRIAVSGRQHQFWFEGGGIEN